MDTLLVVVTALALTAASTMAIVAARVWREERRRSDARVAALAFMADSDATPPAPRRPATPAQGDLELPLHGTRINGPEATGAVPAAPREVAGVGTLFMEPEHTSPWSRRLAVIGSLAAVVLVIGIAAASWTARTQDERAPLRAGASSPAPLELLSLRHGQQDGALTITGLVQNPRGSAPLERVAATAFLFDGDGTFLVSGRAPLDFTTLGPGEESPFVIQVAVKGPVARYRIGFRTEDGRVIAHVDKRAAVTVARK